MARGKLILICQSGGEFSSSDDGSLSYTGGDAHPVVIQPETLFDDLKLKFAEMWNLDYKSISIKYFLPGNKRTLITLSNDKGLKRMIDFHGDAVSADVFVMGKEGFDRNSLGLHGGREFGLTLADTVNCVGASKPTATSCQAAGATPNCDASMPANPTIPISSTAMETTTAQANCASVANANPTDNPSFHLIDFVSAPADSVIASVATTRRFPRKASTSKKSSRVRKNNESSNAETEVPGKKGAFLADATEIDMGATPADTVKKRRRTASWKIGANGPTIVAVTDDTGEKGNSVSPKKNSRGTAAAPVPDGIDLEVDTFPSDDDYDESPESDSDDISPENLVASWKHGITGVGQEFKSVVEFRDALQKYAIARRFTYRLKKNDTNRASGRCVAEGCSWRIHASWVPAEQTFRIKKMNKVHTCGKESRKSAHPSKNWLVNIIKERLRDSPHQKPKEIANGISKDFGIELNYAQVWRGIEGAREQIQGSYEEAYSQLPWLCEKMMDTNPGTVANLATYDDKRFQRLFLSFPALIHGFQEGCRPIIFLDSTSLRSKYQETLLVAVAIDGNDGFFPVALAISSDEHNDCWHWFLEQLKSVLSTSRSMTFVSDKEKGLKEHVLEIFENAHHGYSMYYLLENIKSNLKGQFYGDGKGSILGNFFSAAHAARLDGFKKYTEQIKQISPAAYDWVMQIEPEHWTSALFTGERYNQITVDTVEPYAKLIEEKRELPIVQKVDAIIRMVVDLVNTRRVDSSNCTTKLAPSKEEKLLEEIRKAYGLKVLFSSDILFEVHDDCINVVNIEKQECSCLAWKADGLPCRHAIAVFNSTGRSAYDYCSKYFTVDAFRSTYSESVNSLPCSLTHSNHEDSSDTARVLPPSTSRPKRREKQKHFNKTPEFARRAVACTRCKRVGHNKATCKADL